MFGKLSVPYAEYDSVEKEYTIISSRREKDNVVFRVIANKSSQMNVR